MGEFFAKVYEAVKQIPRGRVATYGQIAILAGKPHGSQRVGYALHANPDRENIPCHRVVNRFGRVAKAYRFGGENAQRALLESEGIVFEKDGSIDLTKYDFMSKQEM